MLDHLNFVAYYLAGLVVGIISISLLYACFTYYGSYRWSIWSSKKYLLSHGRGCRVEDNQYAIRHDKIRRVLFVPLFTIFSCAVGFLALKEPGSRWGLITASIIFMTFVALVESRFELRIGLLDKVNEKNSKAFFSGLDGLTEQFTYEYGEGARELLLEKKKYIVADYLVFKMFGGIDSYEWGDIDLDW